MALRRCTETLWCVRIIFLLESVVVLLWFLDMRRGERPGLNIFSRQSFMRRFSKL